MKKSIELIEIVVLQSTESIAEPSMTVSSQKERLYKTSFFFKQKRQPENIESISKRNQTTEPIVWLVKFRSSKDRGHGQPLWLKPNSFKMSFQPSMRNVPNKNSHRDNMST